MDQGLRNKLRGVVTQCRRLLEDSVRDELQGKFGVYVARKDDVQVDDEARMTHLGDEERAARKEILDHLAHIKARGFKPREALDQLVREVAFTHLNRLCAYKMMEARQVYVGEQRFREAVSRGVNSNGVKFYLADHPDDERLFTSGQQDVAYRHFLDWLGGLLSEEIGVLFSPHDPANRLYPPQRVLDEVLALINDEALADIWAQDETIGWVYQYFTPKELRDQARKESQAPRNSYELAFRNQFFTPRYVVEFLTDNTLGRIWYEMRKGDTKLKDQCRYMVRRPSEVFQWPQMNTDEHRSEKKEGTDPSSICVDPCSSVANSSELSQEELLKLPVYIPHRLKKDPRELKILDPACGSGHFLLYCFDLLLTIYEEAYADAELGPALQRDYPTLDALQWAVPGLILRHNLHGIDIDLRATQIASLALWLRCQRQFNELAKGSSQRTKDKRQRTIRRSNFVCAEPMSGEEYLLKEFVDQVEPKLLGQLVEVVFEKMKLAGEAGALLKIEEEIRDAVAEARRQWLAGPVSIQRTLFDDDKPVVRQQRFDFSGITDSQFFEQAEAKVVEALSNYAEKAQNGQRLRRQLFTEDAVRGFAFVDLCHQRFDVVLMNPPFGECIESSKSYLRGQYPNAISDAGMMFVFHGVDMLLENGMLGAITNRTCLATSQLEEWRREIPLGRAPVSIIADLGYGVLDTAKVEAAAYILKHTSSYGEVTGLRLLDSLNKGPSLLTLIASARNHTFDVRIQVTRHLTCLNLPLAAIVYWAPCNITRLMTPGRRLRDFAPAANDGGHTGDDFRFVRSAWEIPAEWIGENERFVLFAKGGEYAPFWDDFHLVVKWEQDGAEIRTIPGARIYHEDLYFKPGLTYPLRTTSDFSPRILPTGVLFSTGGHGIHFPTKDDSLVFLSLAYTRFVKVCVEILFGSGDASIPGTMARNYTAGTMSQLPYPKVLDKQNFVLRAVRLVGLFRIAFDNDETSRTFSTLPIPPHANSLREGLWESLVASLERLSDVSLLMKQVEDESAEAFGIHGNVDAILDYIYGKHPCDYSERDVAAELQPLLGLPLSELVNAAAVSTGGRNRSITMKSFFVDRRIDLYSHVLKVHPSSICQAWTKLRVIPQTLAVDTASSLISIGLGCVFGRWDGRKLCSQEPARSESDDPFTCLPRCSPATLTDDAGLPARESPTNYELVVNWGGIIPEDPDHSEDIIRRVRDVLETIWKERAEAIEKEACEILGVKELRDYFRKPGKGGFWDDHVSRYSKSRRKAPIYWLLQSSKKNYALWLYYHRLDKDLLFKALVNYVEPKIRLEDSRLEALRTQKTAAGNTGKEAKRFGKEVERQEEFLSELRDFEDKLRRAANLHLEPDLNDGVVLNIAPLHELVPWKEAKSYWQELLDGKYEWSSIAKQLRVKEHVK